MKFKQIQTLEQIATLLNVEYVGNKDFPVKGINEIHVVEKGDIVFVDHPKYYDKALNSAATTILINKKVECPEGKALLISEDPFRDFNKITQHFKPFQSSNLAISTSAKIGKPIFAMAKYEKIFRITIPIGGAGLILISTELDANVNGIVDKILAIQSKYSEN